MTITEDRRRAPWEASAVEALRAGDGTSFTSLVMTHHASMLRIARCYVADRATAEDVVQETWLAVIRGIDRFHGRSSLKTWIFRILVNRARTIGVRAARVVPISSVVDGSETEDGGADPGSLFDARPHWSSHWCGQSSAWASGPEDRVAAAETLESVLDAIGALPHLQRLVITLRDVECWDAKEACAELGLSEGNQRVILHRARAGVRRLMQAAS